VASLVLEAFIKVWGDNTFNETPRLERILRCMFHMFAANQLPLTEAHQFLQAANRAYRQNLLGNVASEPIRSNWQEIERLPAGEKQERFDSSWNRLQRFLAFPALERLFGAEGQTVNFTEVFNRGQILIVNLSLLPSTEAQSLVGTVLMNALYHAAKLRPEGWRRLWVLAIDEFPQFVTADLARSLDELRKFGIRLILAHQHLAQLPPELSAAIFTDAKIRMVFGGARREDAEILARELFTGEVHAQRIKYRTIQTKFRPRLAERELRSFGESHTTGVAETEGWSESTSSSEGESSGEALSDGTVAHMFGGSVSSGWSSGPENGFASSSGSNAESYGSTSSGPTETRTSGASSASGESSGVSGSRSHSQSKTRGQSRSTAFVTEHEEFREETSRQYWTLEEQWEKLVARIMRLDKREALVKVFNRAVLDIATPEVEPPRRVWTRPQGARRMPPTRSGQPQSKPKGRPPSDDDLPDDFRE
jgi:hypothetical protein